MKTMIVSVIFLSLSLIILGGISWKNWHKLNLLRQEKAMEVKLIQQDLRYCYDGKHVTVMRVGQSYPDYIQVYALVFK